MTDTGPRTGKLVTAAQIENGCPERLAALGNRIKAHLERAERAERHADNNRTTAALLLAEARKACDAGGFSAFRQKYCPTLGQSQAYVLLAIAAGKKTAEEVRAEERERKQRTRARQKAVADSGTVPEKSEPESAAPSPALAWTPPALPPTAKTRRSRAEARLEQHQQAVWVICNTVENVDDLVIPPNLDPEGARADSAKVAEAIKRLRRLKAALDAVAQSGDAADDVAKAA